MRAKFAVHSIIRETPLFDDLQISQCADHFFERIFGWNGERFFGRKGENFQNSAGVERLTECGKKFLQSIFFR